MTNLDTILKRRHYLANKGPPSQNYDFSSNHVWMWELDNKKSWPPKNSCLWIVVLEKTLENPLDSKEIKPANPKRNQPWIFTGRTDVEAEAPILWPPDTNSQLIGKDPERLKARGEGDDREWDGWTASLTQWTWVWATSGRWRTWKPGMAQSMGSQKVRHDWVTEWWWLYYTQASC